MRTSMPSDSRGTTGKVLHVGGAQHCRLGGHSRSQDMPVVLVEKRHLGQHAPMLLALVDLSEGEGPVHCAHQPLAGSTTKPATFCSRCSMTPHTGGRILRAR